MSLNLFLSQMLRDQGVYWLARFAGKFSFDSEHVTTPPIPDKSFSVAATRLLPQAPSPKRFAPCSMLHAPCSIREIRQNPCNPFFL
jgi:hypothetical protein